MLIVPVTPVPTEISYIFISHWSCYINISTYHFAHHRFVIIVVSRVAARSYILRCANKAAHIVLYHNSFFYFNILITSESVAFVILCTVFYSFTKIIQRQVHRLHQTAKEFMAQWFRAWFSEWIRALPPSHLKGPADPSRALVCIRNKPFLCWTTEIRGCLLQPLALQSLINPAKPFNCSNPGFLERIVSSHRRARRGQRETVCGRVIINHQVVLLSLS